jgi:hypothetical protein
MTVRGSERKRYNNALQNEFSKTTKIFECAPAHHGGQQEEQDSERTAIVD